MPIDPAVAGLLQQMEEAGGPRLEELTPVEAREAFLPMIELQGPPEPVPQVSDRTVPGPAGAIPVRVYAHGAATATPALVYFHGGGWVVGNIEFHDRVCRALANALGCAVISVEYRLAPEHRFPAAADDCYAATRWIAEHAGEFGVDPSRIAIGGDSAGGNLTAVVALMARDRGGPALVFQWLHCPVTDADFSTRSYQENADGYLLTQAGMRWFWDHYVPNDVERADPLASPLRAPSLAGLPPALVQTAEFDPLHDEGVAYAKRLREAGVAVTHTDYPGMIHDPVLFLSLFPQSREALNEAVTQLRRAFGS
jgi:acetyl esterase